MTGGALMPLLAGLCFLLAALCSAAGWRAGLWIGAAGVAGLLGAMVARGLLAGYWPLTGMYEFALAFALATALAAGIAGFGGGERFRMVHAVALLFSAALVAYARLVLPVSEREIQSLAPTLRSVWLPLHVAASALAFGALAVAAAAALVWLWGPVGSGAAGQALRSEIAWFQDRAIAAGYPVLTLSMILGMVWAQWAWGRYWDWNLKEVWTFATWLVFTLHWHLRSRPRWKGRRLAWVALAGFGSALFSLLGTGWLARAIALQSLQQF
jgi:ABC-type transport system involved in cytochrome c biogenesis permease subunit